MGIFNRFFGKRIQDDNSGDLVAGAKKEDSPALQILFAHDLKFNNDAITKELRDFHPSMTNARCEMAEEMNQEGKTFGLVGWGKHVIQLVGFDLPMPKVAVELCVAPSHYAQSLKVQARAHKSHLLMWYAGTEESEVEQFVALAAFAGVLEHFGAIIILNEAAHTSFPAEALSRKAIKGDMLEELRALPLPVLYCGLVKYDIPDDTHVWMRTYGAYVMNVPDLAVYSNGHHEGQRYLSIFDNILRYMISTGSLLAPGHTMQIGESDYLICRAPNKKESWLDSKGDILVVEVVQGDQVNQ